MFFFDQDRQKLNDIQELVQHIRFHPDKKEKNCDHSLDVKIFETIETQYIWMSQQLESLQRQCDEIKQMLKHIEHPRSGSKLQCTTKKPSAKSRK